jgi:hypothetical protein
MEIGGLYGAEWSVLNGVRRGCQESSWWIFFYSSIGRPLQPIMCMSLAIFPRDSDCPTPPETLSRTHLVEVNLKIRSLKLGSEDDLTYVA